MEVRNRYSSGQLGIVGMNGCHRSGCLGCQAIEFRCGNPIIKTFNNFHGHLYGINKFVESITELTNPGGNFVKHDGFFAPISFYYIHNVVWFYWLNSADTIGEYWCCTYPFLVTKSRRRKNTFLFPLSLGSSHLLFGIPKPAFQRNLFFLEAKSYP